ncbi:hypothetical protein [Sphingomonas sp. PB4P5]|uniref:hypothetical protein n=1 Tax=Parasphingomonas puruogangriensis TaxID=3096155 RepID=UPI002FC80C01
MIEDVTTTWKATKPVSGLYIVRSIVDPSRIRISAGGNRGGKAGLHQRLMIHGRVRVGAPTCETHVFAPFDVLHAWRMNGWTAPQIKAGETCLYRAFLIGFPRHNGNLPDDSLFAVPHDYHLEPVIAEVEADLHTLARINVLAA